MSAIDEDSACSPDPGRIRLLVPLLILAGLLAYANSFDGAFVLDDLSHIVQDTALADGGPTQAVVDSRPLTNLTLWFNHAMDRMLGGNGLDPLGYHLLNLMVHLLAGLTLFTLVARSLQPTMAAATAVAFAAALLWIVHPLTTQAVTYVIQRSESMMGLFFLATIYGVARGADDDQPRWWYAAAIGAGWLSCLSKQVAVVLPVVVLLYDRGFLAGTVVEAIRRRWAVYVLLGASSLILIGFAVAAAVTGDGEEASAGFGMQRLTPWGYALTQPGVILHYLRLAVWPSPLVFDYHWPVASEPGQVIVSVIVVAGLVAVSAAALWRWPKAGFLPAAFFLILAPTSSVMPIADLAVEHRMYLPLAAITTGVSVAVAWALQRWAGRRWLAVGAVMLAASALALGVGTHLRNRDYHSPERLWRDTIAKRPNNPRAHHNLANVLFARGDVTGSLPAYRHALELEPRHAMARVNYGVALLRAGEREAGRQQFERALEVWPSFGPALNQLGILHAKAGEYDEAAKHFLEAIASDPGSADPYVHLGHVYFARGASSQAAAAYEAALELRPDDPQVHNNLGIISAQSGRLREAADHFARAVELDGSFEDAKANLQRAREMLRQPSP